MKPTVSMTMRCRSEPAAPPTPRWWAHRFGAMTTWACSPITVTTEKHTTAVKSISRARKEATVVNTSAYWRAMSVASEVPSMSHRLWYGAVVSVPDAPCSQIDADPHSLIDPH
jgi:hypothetical protein